MKTLAVLLLLLAVLTSCTDALISFGPSLIRPTITLFEAKTQNTP